MLNACSVQFSCSVVSDPSRPHESQHARPPCPSTAPGVHSNSRPSSQWCHPAISSSVVPFSSCPQSLPAPGSFPVSQLFTWGGQRIGVSALASVLPGLISFRMDWLNLLKVQGTLKSLLQQKVWRKGNPLTLLVGMQTSTATMENSVDKERQCQRMLKLPHNCSHLTH